MITDIKTPMSKTTELPEDEVHAFSKSLRYITSKWLGKETNGERDKDGDREKDKDKNRNRNKSNSPKKVRSDMSICLDIDSEAGTENETETEIEIKNWQDNQSENKPLQENIDIINLEAETAHSTFNSKLPIPKGKISDPTVINLNVDAELENININSNSPSPNKNSKRRKAFNTIKSYLEKNKSQQSISRNNSSSSFEINKDIPKIEKMKKPSNSINLDSFTIFDEKESKTSISNSFNENLCKTIDTSDTKIDQAQHLFDMFENGNKDLISVQSLKHYTDSEASADIITLVKNANNLNKYVKDTKAIHTELSANENDKDVFPNFKNQNISYNIQSNLVSLYIGDLSKDVTESDLFKYFSKFEGLISVKIPIDIKKNESLGYGYVNFNNQTNADLATEELNYTNLKGSEIRIMPSLRDKEKREQMGANIFFSHLSSNLSSRVMYDRLKIYGKILSCKYSKEKSTCFVNFENKIEAYKVCKLFNQSDLDGKTINASIHISKKDRENFQTKFANGATMVDMSKGDLNKNIPVTPIEKPISTQFSIFMKNLPLDLSTDVIKTLVERYGTVKKILTRNVPEKDGSWALITMTSKQAIDRTIQNLNSFEIEGKTVFVTRAIPREEKEYAKKEQLIPNKKLKLLVSGLNLQTDRKFLQDWCDKCESIKSAEFFGNNDKFATELKKSSGYGYIELVDEKDADSLIEQIKSLGVSCYKIKIEIPSKEESGETSRYPFVVNNKQKFLPHKVSFSYVDPSKMFQIANFHKTVDEDKINIYQNMENYNKYKLKHRNNLNNDKELLNEKMNEMYRAVWEISVRQFKRFFAVAQPKGYHGFGNNFEFLSKSKVESLTTHLIKFFWANNFDEFYKFMKNNQFDSDDRIIYTPHPVLSVQLYESALYLGIIPKPK